MTAHWGIEDPAAVEGTDTAAFHCGEPDCRCPMAAAILNSIDRFWTLLLT
jgi:hypothetical protein